MIFRNDDYSVHGLMHLFCFVITIIVVVQCCVNVCVGSLLSLNIYMVEYYILYIYKNLLLLLLLSLLLLLLFQFH